MPSLRASRAPLLALLLATALAWPSAAQDTPPTSTPAAAPEKAVAFDIISIRENKSGDPSMRWQNTATSYIATNVTLITILTNAYGLREDQVSGAPGWFTSTRFDVQGKVLEGSTLRNLSRTQYQNLLRSIFTQRLQLKAHLESRQAATYDLLVARGGSKLKAVPPVDPAHPEALTGTSVPRGGFSYGPGQIQMTALPISRLADLLAMQLQRTVIDKTALTGVFDYKLTWTPDADTPTSTDSTAPSLFTALQEQLGLRLQSSRGPVDTLVIDHVEPPSSNDD